jgi:hypothetical protein
VVAGVVASMMAAKPSLPASQIESLLYSTSLDLGAAGRDSLYGWGRVNAQAAVTAAASAVVSDTTAPTLSFASPSSGSNVSGLVTVSANASDNVGVARVELRVNGTLVGTDTLSPYQFAWDTTTLPNGSASLQAIAYDGAGNAKSASLSVNVANGTTLTADTTPPVIASISPGDGTSVTGQVSISASASDNAGASGITQTLSIDGKQIATVTGGSLATKWNTRNVAKGVHTLMVTAQDAAGNRTTRSVSVTVR